MIDETLHSFSGAHSQTVDNIFSQINKSTNNSEYFNQISINIPFEMKLNECMKEGNTKMINTINSFLQFDLDNQYNFLKYWSIICQSLFHLNDIINNPYSSLEDKLICLDLQAKLVDKLINGVESRVAKMS